MATDQSDYIKTALRLPRSVHEQLLAMAMEAGRSLNAEIIYRLEQSFVEGFLRGEQKKELIDLVNAAIDERLERMGTVDLSDDRPIHEQLREKGMVEHETRGPQRVRETVARKRAR